MLLHRPLLEWANRKPDATAFRWVNRKRSLTYSQAVADMERLAGALHHLNIRKGDRVTIVAHNGLDYLTGMLACWRVGAIAALVNVQFAEELEYFFADHEPKLIIYTHDIGRQVQRAAKVVPGTPKLVCMDGPQEGAESLPDLLSANLRPPPDPEDETAIAHLSYTSGTTGRPKGACLAHEPTMRAANCIAERLRITPEDISFGPTALSSSYQLVANLLPPLHRGAAINVMSGWAQQSGFDAFDEAQATVLVANPIILASVLAEYRQRKEKPGRLRISVSGGAPVPPALKMAWRDELGVSLVESYGQSELGGFVALGDPILPSDEALTAIGRALPDKEVRVFDQDGVECTVGVVGELCLRGGYMAGYWNKPDATADTLRGGWLHTGDAGIIDRNGRITMRGRFSELIKVGEQTWFPRDVEEAIALQPGVQDAALVAVEDKRLGQRPVAFIAANDRKLDSDTIRNGIAGLLPYDVSHLVIQLVETLPMTATGKIAKAQLKEEAAKRV